MDGQLELLATEGNLAAILANQPRFGPTFEGEVCCETSGYGALTP